jgi:hypothetical protein
MFLKRCVGEVRDLRGGAGAPEAAVVNQLQELINPHSARQLLNVLMLRNLIKVREVTTTSCGPPMWLRSPSTPPPAPQVWNFFLGPRHYIWHGRYLIM